MMVSLAGLSSSSFCIVRKLYDIVSIRTASISHAEVRSSSNPLTSTHLTCQLRNVKLSLSIHWFACWDLPTPSSMSPNSSFRSYNLYPDNLCPSSRIFDSLSPGIPMEINALRTHPRGPLTQEEKKRRRALGLCNYCGGPNHIASDCPNKKKTTWKKSLPKSMKLPPRSPALSCPMFL